MNSKSIVHSALQEQMRLDLPWFRNIKPLLKLDPLYSTNHVAAFNQSARKSKRLSEHPSYTASSLQLARQSVSNKYHQNGTQCHNLLKKQ